MGVVRVGVVQVPSVAEGVVELIGPLIGEAAGEGAGLVVLPEGVMHDFRPGVDLAAVAEPLDGHFTGELADLARNHGVTLVAGMWEKVAGESRVSNTLVVHGPSGRLEAVYRKIHLFDSFGFAESERVVPGPLEPIVFPLGEFVVGLMTCYDLRFPELARALAALGADLLVAPAGWVAGPNKLHHWETLITARAIENTLYVAAAAITGPGYTGHSMIVDPMGELLASLGEEPGTVSAPVTVERISEVRALLPSLRHRRMLTGDQVRRSEATRK